MHNCHSVIGYKGCPVIPTAGQLALDRCEEIKEIRTRLLTSKVNSTITSTRADIIAGRLRTLGLDEDAESVTELYTLHRQLSEELKDAAQSMLEANTHIMDANADRSEAVNQMLRSQNLASILGACCGAGVIALCLGAIWFAT